MKRTALERQLERLASQRWSRRGVRTLIQAACLGVSCWVIGLGGHLAFGWNLDYTILKALFLGIVAFGAVMLLRPRIPAQAVAERIDQRFGLNEQVATALEVSQRGEAEGVAAHLLMKASHNTAQVQRFTLQRYRFPWVETGTLVALLLLTGGMLLLVSIQLPDSLYGSAEPLPPLAQPDDPPEEFPMEPFEPPPGSGSQMTATESEGGMIEAVLNSNQPTLSAIADALRDLSVTRSVAEAIDQGDIARAAQNLREVADQADRLSSETRRDLSNALQDAANEIGPSDPDTSTKLRDSSHEMQQDSEGAADALDNLASTLEELGGLMQQSANNQQTPPSQTPQEEQTQDWQNNATGSSNAGNDVPPDDQRERSRPHERLGVEGVPFELEGGDDGNTPTSSDDEIDAALDDSGAGRFETGASSTDNNIVEAEEDPLRIPADLRDVVQEYFSPSQ